MRIIVLALLLFTASPILFAQTTKPDVIVKANGEEISGKVLEVNDSEIRFTYAGETAVYTLKKVDIAKITYSSGRVETFNSTAPVAEAKPAPAAAPDASEEDSHNKVAVLPFQFIKDGQLTADVLNEKVQIEATTFLSKHAGIYTIVDARTTNAKLIKAGLNNENMKGYTMDEICKILGVEYIVEGIVSVDQTTQTNLQSNQSKTTTTEGSNSKSYKKDRNTSGSSYSTSTQNYATTLVLNIYNNKGKTVFAQERKSFFTTADAYRSALEYLLKRAPVYTR